MLIQSVAFWTLIVGLLAFVVKFFSPSFPFDETQILAAVLFVLGLFGVIPSVRAKGFAAVGAGSILKSLQFWTMVCGLVSFVIHYFAPSFPFAESAILAFVVYVLGFFQITPELRARGLK
jgi:uncharacterized membrane protein YqjE